MSEPLTDQSKMPFGQAYKGRKMEDVPASYLFWYWTNCDRTAPVGKYIEKNLAALEKEYPDGIWR
jgi:uncharacterized protein (DUF3820 family)